MAKHPGPEVIRHYLLQTLTPGGMKTTAAHLKACGECRTALEVERERLAALGALPVEVAPGGLAARTMERIGERQEARRPSYAGLVVAATMVFVLFLTGYIALGKSREAARRASTQGNMKQLGLLFKMYANESPGDRWPRLASASGSWTPDLAPWFEKAITDTQCMVSEQHPDRKALKRALAEAWAAPQPDVARAGEIFGESFAYLGYSIEDEADFEALQRARENHLLPGEDGGPNAVGPDSLQPLREGVERFLITDINNAGASSKAQSSIPVLIEIATWKYRASDEEFKGTNVLYMDGHVSFVPLGTFPVLPSILDALSEPQA